MMGKRWMFPLITFALILIGNTPLQSQGAEGSIFIQLDFEEDNGELTHGGSGDLWEWGVPGPNVHSNPGPIVAGEGSKVWGCPLNGTYAEGSDTYLLLPRFDPSDASTLKLSFMCWYDLSISDDEQNETGNVQDGDECILEARVDNGNWIVINTYNGTSGSSWVNEEIDLTNYLDGVLEIRFRVVDNNDGFTDNGFFLDMVEMSGEEKPEVSISLGPDAYIPPVVVVNELVRIEYELVNEGKTVPPASYATVYVESVGGTPEFYNSYEISPTTSGKRSVDWYPSAKGSYRGWINLTIGGVYQEGLSFNVRCYTPVYYDDASSGTSHMTVQNGVAEAEWTIIQPPIDGFSMSGEKVFWYGSPNGGPNGTNGFQGPTWAYIETDWVDLTYYTNSFLYMYHRFSFLGPRGSSGGVVEAYSQTGSWKILEPIDLSYTILRNNVSGPLGGGEGIVGTSDWDVNGFKLAPFIGDRTRIRLSVAADGSGWGEGWLIDDLMVVGEGYDPFDTEPPTQIEGLEVEVIDEGAVTLSWYPSNARDFLAYNVYLEGFDFNDVTGLVPHLELDSTDQDSVVITDLDPSKEYWAAVTAVDVVENEEKVVDSISFIPSSANNNRSPIADIKIVGGSYARSVDEDITFDASGSHDPDDDPMTYTWTMPDGSVFRGSLVTWRSDQAGEDLVVTLVVKDNGGLSDTETVTIDIVKDKVSILERGEIWPFLMIVIPLLVIVLGIVIIAAYLRGNTKKRLEKRLEKIGIGSEKYSPVGSHEPVVIAQVHEKNKKPSPKVHDVVAVKKKEKEPEVKAEELPHWEGPRRHEHRPKHKPSPKGGDTHEKLHYHPPPLVKVVIECPFCNEIFKEKVDPNILKDQQVFTVKCPHCGRGGDITP